MEVAADWHGLVAPRHNMQPSIACDSRQVHPQCNTTDIPPPQSAALGFRQIAEFLEGRVMY